MAEVSAKPRVVVVQFPGVNSEYETARALDSVGLDDAEDLMTLLRSHSNVRGVVWGHVHQEFESSTGDIRLMGSPSTCYQFLPLKDTFDIDDLPAGYRRICLSDDGQIDSQVMWVADGAG